MLIVGEDNNLLDNFGSYKDERPVLDIKEDNINLTSKSLDIRSCIRNILLKYTPYARLLDNKSSSSLKDVRFSD